jgi:hypothetical protein
MSFCAAESRTTLDDAIEEDEGAGDVGAIPEAEAPVKVTKEEFPSENGNEEGSMGRRRLDEFDVVDKLDPITEVCAITLDDRPNGNDNRELLAGKPDANEVNPEERKVEVEVVVVEDERTELESDDGMDDGVASGMTKVGNSGEEDKDTPVVLVRIGIVGEVFVDGFPAVVLDPSEVAL